METQVTDPIQAPQTNVEQKNSNTYKIKLLSKYVVDNITVISIAGFILLAIGIVAFFYYQNQALKKMLVKYAEPSPTPIVSNDPLASWKLYKSESDSYQLKFPQEWGQTEQVKTDPHKVVFQSSDGLYRFTADAQANRNKATGKAFGSLDEFIGLPYAVKALKVDGQDSRQSMPRSGFENFNKVYFFSQDTSLIFSLELLVGDGTKTDHRVTFEALKIGADIFEKIISTFQFTTQLVVLPLPTDKNTDSSQSGKACTMEARICPDGSSVGRSGPNCEFAPCPTPKSP